MKNELDRKINRCKSEISVIENQIREYKTTLDKQKTDRVKEDKRKAKLIAKIDFIKNKIEQMSRFSEQNIANDV